MTYVVTEACIQCKYTDCVTVCPMDCFFEGPNFLVIQNRTLSDTTGWTRISRQKAPLPDHEYWATQTGKLALLKQD